MSDEIQIKQLETHSKGGLKVVITHLLKNPYNRFMGFYIDSDGKNHSGMWQDNGMKCNGTGNLDIDVNNPEIIRIVENASILWESEGYEPEN